MDDLDPEICHGEVEGSTFRQRAGGDVLFEAFEDHIFSFIGRSDFIVLKGGLINRYLLSDRIS